MKRSKDETIVKVERKNNRLNIRFENQLKKSRLLTVSLIIFLLGFNLFFLLALFDYILDTFSSRSGFITQFDRQENPVPSSLKDIFILLLINAFASSTGLLIASETSIILDTKNLNIHKDAFGIPLRKITIPLTLVEEINISFEKSLAGEFAYFVIKSRKKVEKRFQIYDSDPKIPAEIKEQFSQLLEIIGEFLLLSDKLL